MHQDCYQPIKNPHPLAGDHIELQTFGPLNPELGAKFDNGKVRFSLLTRGLAEPLKRVAEVLEYGARKYSPNSWQHVPNAKERYEDALDRHLNAWKSGESHDAESKLHHLAHIATNALFLLWFYKEEGND